jgi:hypothetical protein
MNSGTANGSANRQLSNLLVIIKDPNSFGLNALPFMTGPYFVNICS